MSFLTDSYSAIWILIGATLSMGCLVAVIWILISHSQKRASAQQAEARSLLESRANQLSAALNEALENREELTILTTALPGYTLRYMRVNQLEDTAEILVTALKNVLRCKKVLIFLQRDGELCLAGATGLSRPDALPDVIHQGEGEAGWAIKTRMPMIQGDDHRLTGLDRKQVRETEKLAEPFDAYVPMVFDDEVLGLVCVSGSAVRRPDLKGMLFAMINVSTLALINQRRYEEIRKMSEVDPGTGLLNRRSFHAQFRHTMVARPTDPLSIFLLDIDHFKQINDRFGHPFGDEVLVQVANVIHDTVEDDELGCRYGGEEFILMLRSERDASVERALALCDRIRSTPFHVPGGQTISVTASGGLAFSPAEGTHAVNLIKLADERLYAAKHAGRDRIIYQGANAFMPSPAPEEPEEPEDDGAEEAAAEEPESESDPTVTQWPPLYLS
jgi:diguanylate cyclase (GGDEF)-like protein